MWNREQGGNALITTGCTSIDLRKITGHHLQRNVQQLVVYVGIANIFVCVVLIVSY